MRKDTWIIFLYSLSVAQRMGAGVKILSAGGQQGWRLGEVGAVPCHTHLPLA